MNFLAWLFRFFLSFRYSLEVRGLDQLVAQTQKGKGRLFLPNHPAHIDPVIISVLLFPHFRPRPLVVDYMYRTPLLRPLMKLVRALPMPSFDHSVNQLKIKKANEAMQHIADGLKCGENFLLYPAGRIKLNAQEGIGGASAVHSLLQDNPNIDIGLVRITGLWGSSFSRAILGRPPKLGANIKKGLLTLLRNAFFFAPRRKVIVEFETAPRDFPRQASRLQVNRYLENWYDQYPTAEGKRVKSEPLSLVSYSFWSNDVPKPFEPPKKAAKDHELEIDSKMRDKIYAEIRRIMDNPNLEIQEEMDLAFDIGMDSLNIGELIAFLSHEYDISEVHPEDLLNVRGLLEIADGARISETGSHETYGVSWPDEPKRPIPTLPIGKTIPEAFLNSADRLRSLSACADEMTGVLSYNKMKRAALVLAEYFKNFDEERVAIMLPASCGAYLAILALQLAGKVPVMLNWTLGPRYLEGMMEQAQAKKVISSWLFLDKLNHVDFGNLIDNMVLLEDVKESLTLGQKLKGAYLSLHSAPAILRKLHLNKLDENKTAVILFTSGTEATPKGVPLSHRNIISNLRSGMQCLDFRANDVVFGVLPPFHSFGFNVTGLFCILSGLKVAYYPDPTDSFALVSGIDRWNATLFCSPPSFLKGVLSAAKQGQLSSIRYFISGAEKLPQEVREKAQKLVPGCSVIEGYGITECSPILTIARPNLPPKGVGILLPDVEACTIHPETLELLTKGSEGEVCVRGPNVFSGYLGQPRDPFIELEGKKWYRTGDLGYFDEDGTLVLSGRLKRFTKIGGEMISLGAVEEAITSELIARGVLSADQPGLAVCCDEKIQSKPLLVVFTTASFTKEDANEILKKAGFSRLIRISKVQTIETIPLMGTGKTDYRKLQSLI